MGRSATVVGTTKARSAPRRSLRLGLAATTALVSVGYAAGFVTAARAADYTWSGTTTDYNTGSNWTPAGPPVNAGQSAIFSSGGSSAVAVTTGPITPDAWTFNASSQAYTITGAEVDFGGAGVVDQAANTISIANVIGGSGAVLQQGTGTLILTGTNTYTGGTTITSGTLQIGNGGTTGTLPGNVTDNGTLIFDRSNAVTYAGVVSGSGNLTQAGSGTLTLTGNNTYAGTTAVNTGGTIVVSAGTVGGSSTSALANSGTFRQTGGAVSFATVTNSGTIVSTVGAGLNAVANAPFSLTNTGAVTGTTLGVNAANVGAAITIDGAGTVTATAANGNGIVASTSTGDIRIGAATPLGTITAGGTGIAATQSGGGNIVIATAAPIYGAAGIGTAPTNGITTSITGGTAVVTLGGQIGVSTTTPVADIGIDQLATNAGANTANVNANIFATNYGVRQQSANGNNTVNLAANVTIDPVGIAISQTTGNGANSVSVLGGDTVEGNVAISQSATGTGSNTVTVAANGQVTSLSGDGVHQISNSGTSTVFNNGQISGAGAGTAGVYQSAGTATVTNSGAGTISGVAYGVYQSAGSGGATVHQNSSGSITGATGIFATAIGSGNVLIDGSGSGLIQGTTGPGIQATVAAGNTGNVTVGTTVGPDVLAAQVTGSTDGIDASNAGSGSVNVATSNTVTGQAGYGIHAQNTGTGTIAVTAIGNVISGSGVASNAGVFVESNNLGNTVTVNSGATVQGPIGLRIAGINAATGVTTLANAGTIASTLAGGNAIQIDSGTLVIGDQTGTFGSLTGNIDVVNGPAAVAPAYPSTLTFNRTADLTLTSNIIYGAGTVNQNGSGTTNLNYSNTTTNNFTGIINVNAGTLAINGVVGDVVNSAATANVNGGTLTGSGTFDGSVTVNSGTLAEPVNISRDVTVNGGTVSPGGSPGNGTLNVGGNLTYNGGTTVFNLGATGYTPNSANDLINVGRNLHLGGALVLQDDVGTALAAGDYRLYNYNTAGSSTGSGMFSSIPSNADVYFNQPTLSGPGSVNVRITNGTQLVQYWDGNDTNGVTAGAQGGNGTWNTTYTNWTDIASAGTVNDKWRSQIGIFAGGGGTVALQDTEGFQGLQFKADYTVSGAGTLNAMGDPFTSPSGTLSYINVDQNMVATILRPITGAAGVGLSVNPVATETGTLRIGASASYPGLTSVSNGTLEILGTGSITGSSGLTNMATVNLDAGATATFGGGGGTILNTVTGTINNDGMLIGTVSNAGTINTSGIINADAGGFASTGTVNVFDGTTATPAVVNGAITNASTFNVTGVATSNATFANQSGAALNVGTGSGVGTYSIAQLLTNAGTIEVGAGSTLNATAGLTNTASGTVINNGAVNDALNNAGQVTNNGTYTATVASNSGTINNTTGAFWIGDVLSTTGTIANAGTWTAAAAGFSNAGTLTTTGILDATAGGLQNSGTVTASGTIRGAISNTGQFTVGGALTSNSSFFNAAGGVLNVNAQSYTGITTLDNAGAVDLSGGTLSVGLLTNEAGSTFASNGGTINAGTFTNSGRISMVNGQVGDVTTINGNYQAVSSAASLAVDVDLRNTANRITDQLVVNGTVSGNTLVDFTSRLSAPGVINPNIPTFQNGTLIPTTPVVISQGGSGTFTPTTGANGVFATNGGLVQYSLQQTSPGNYAIVSGVNTSAVTPIATSLSGAFSAISSSFFQSTSAFVVPGTGNNTNQPTYGPWIRPSGGAANLDLSGRDSNLGQVSKSQVDTTFAGFQAGFDSGLINVNGSNSNVHFGLTTGLVDADAAEKRASNTNVSFSIPFVGVYGAFKKDAFSADITYRHDFVDLRVRGQAISGQQSTNLGAEGNSVYGNLLYGIPVQGFTVIPSLGLGYSHYSIDNLAVTGGQLNFRNFDSLLGRLGVQVGKTYAVSDRVALQPFVTGAVWHEFEGDTVAQFSQVGVFGSDNVFTTRVGTFGQVGVGLSAQVLPVGLTGFIRGDFRFGDRLNGEAGTMGLRYSF